MVIAERRRAGHSYNFTDAALNDLCEKLYTQTGAVGDADRLQLLRVVFEESDKANPAPPTDRRFNGWLLQCRTDTNKIVAERRKAGYGYTINASGIDQICGQVYGDGARPVTGAALDGAIRAVFTRMEQEADRKLAAADPLRDPRYVAWAPECRTGANVIVAERVAKGYDYRVSASAIDRLCLGNFQRRQAAGIRRRPGTRHPHAFQADGKGSRQAGQGRCEEHRRRRRRRGRLLLLLRRQPDRFRARLGHGRRLRRPAVRPRLTWRTRMRPGR
jgi:hypothetical protein